ncbi:MAG TPA: hypothetical protein PKI14_07170 [Fervidobacterium sp.]|nr:hypothetical protein [Fervidobacterium sp.]
MAKVIFRIPTLANGWVTDIPPMALEAIGQNVGGYASVLLNVDVGGLGILRRRPGIQNVYAPTVDPIRGLHEFVKNSTGKIYKLAVAGTALWSWNEDETKWDMVATGLPATGKVSFLNFADSVLLAIDGQAVLRWDGITDTVPPNFPMSKYLAEYRLRVAAAGDPDNPTLLYLSHTGDPTLWDPDADGSNAMKLFVSPDDGDYITGLVNAGEGGLVIGKQRSIYGLFGYARSNITVDLIENSVGVVSHWSMQYIRPYVYFVSADGIYKLQVGGTAERISQPIQSVFESTVNYARLSETTAARFGDYYVVTLPVGESDYITWAYHCTKTVWSEWTNPIMGVAAVVSNDSSSPLYACAPNSNQVYKVSTSLLSDNGAAIPVTYTTVPLHAGVPESDKDITDIYVVFKQDPVNAYNVNVSVVGDTPGFDTWQDLGTQTVTSGTGYVTLRFPLHSWVTTRYFYVRMTNDQADTQFSPVAMSVILEVKEVT